MFENWVKERIEKEKEFKRKYNLTNDSYKLYLDNIEKFIIEENYVYDKDIEIKIATALFNELTTIYYSTLEEFTEELNSWDNINIAILEEEAVALAVESIKRLLNNPTNKIINDDEKEVTLDLKRIFYSWAIKTSVLLQPKYYFRKV